MAGITTSEVRTNAWSLNDYYRQSLQFNDKNRRYIGGGELWMWGRNDVGQLGQENTTQYSSPVQVPGVWRTVWATGYNTYATKPDGSLWSWGRNHKGQLGHGDKTDISSPKQVAGSNNWVHVRATRENAMGIRDNGSIWAWGNNTYGQNLQGAGGLTHDMGANSYSPMPVMGSGYNDYDWSTKPNQVARQTTGGTWLKNDGSLWTWGDGQYGALGTGISTIYYSSPTQIPGDWTGATLANDGSMQAATKPDGTLWAWGRNYWGTLGQNQNQSDMGSSGGYSSAVQIPGTGWYYPVLSSFSLLCVKGDGTLWGLGANQGNGELGQNSLVNYSSPVQIPGTTWTGAISASYGSLMAKKSDGTLWGWGRNTNGQLGLNDVVNRSSPTQVPGSDWGENSWAGSFPSSQGAYAFAFGVIKPG